MFLAIYDFRICCDIAEVATSKREYDQAIRSYKEALSHDSSHVKVLLRTLQVLYVKRMETLFEK